MNNRNVEVPLSAQQLSDLMPGIFPSAWVVRQRAREGYIPSHKLGRRYIFYLNEVNEALKKLGSAKLPENK